VSGGSRGQNLALALGCVATHSGAVSRAGISARTGLHRSTASSLVDELITGGLVRETGVDGRHGVGRPATILALAGRGPAGVGVEISPHLVVLSVVDLTGEVRYLRTVEQPAADPTSAEALAWIGGLVRQALAVVAEEDLQPLGVAVSVAGPPDQDTGETGRTPGDLVATLRRPGLPPHVVLDRGTYFAALSEDGYPGADQSYLYLDGRDGIEAGLVLEGVLYRGARGWGCEVGHQPADPDGSRCPCGRRGCLDQCAGYPAVLRAAGLSDVHPAGRIPVELVLDRVNRGDRPAVEAVTRAGTALGRVVARCLSFLDLDRVVLGGVYRELAPWVVPEMERELTACFIGFPRTPPAVTVAARGPDAAAVGAARSLVRQVIRDPMVWLCRGDL
jgi:predicted NBD/HSP70 family sugar kinase